MGKPLRLLVTCVPASIVLSALIVYATRSRFTCEVTGIDNNQDQRKVDEHDVQEGVALDTNSITLEGSLMVPSHSGKDDLRSNSTWNPCTFHTCFNLEKCPFTHPFATYVYDDLLTSSSNENPFSPQLLVDVLKETVFFGTEKVKEKTLATWRHKFTPWHSGGNMAKTTFWLSFPLTSRSMLEGVSTGKAIIARSVISPAKPFSTGFDILLPPLRTAEADSMDLLSPLLPVSRETFIHFHGEHSPHQHPGSGAITPQHIRSLQQLLKGKERVNIQLQCQQPATGKTKRAVEGSGCCVETRNLDLSSVPSLCSPSSQVQVALTLEQESVSILD
ncbi:Exostosin-like 3 [Geodia barretti]|uniref:Exostosin-like 3 n=1 Tax=Geodia barretti TaxID=519541 RepID=A0AA35R7I3_GEOBA|nr:Exostosin-like 3 [Geodia barretti]